MIIFKKFEDYTNYINRLINQKQNIGFVPTMGALHEGHISLITHCKKISDITIASIFINPTQFNNKEDFNHYPVTLEQDIYLLETNGCDILLLPDEKDVYPNGKDLLEKFDLGPLEFILEGKYRPGHFQGVCQVVKRFIEIIKPDQLILGQKDLQQCMIIKKLITKVDPSINVVIAPTIRESDGLAMSSRNLRLSKEERTKAVAIFNALSLMKNNLQKGNIEDDKSEAKEILIKAGFTLDYLEVATLNDLTIINDIEENIPAVALVAATVNNIRLIDNMPL